MNYSTIKKEFIEEYKKFGNQNFEEIDYVFCELTKTPKTNLLFCEIDNKTIKKATKIIKKHLTTKKPLQKIFKKAYFYGFEFYVSKNVLTPRQDSEILVENALNFNFSSCLDLCCGSGCLGLSIAKIKPEISLTLADVSKKALKTTKINAKKHKIKAKFVKTNMFENIKEKFDLIVCNPPYIESDVINFLSDEVKNFDPIISLDGGIDGLKFYRILFDNAIKFLNKNGKCLLEIGYNQGNLVKLFEKKYKNVKLIKDYNNQNRVIIFEKGD